MSASGADRESLSGAVAVVTGDDMRARADQIAEDDLYQLRLCTLRPK
jgi:hypothetical protein